MQNNIAPFYFAGLGSLGGLFGIIVVATTILLHILFAICISNDTARLRDQGRPVVVLTPFAWTLAALVMGLIAVAFYWLCHYSRFIKRDT